MILETGLYGLLWHQNVPAYFSWTSQHAWIYHVCEFNYTHEIRLNIAHAELKPRREGDQSIMAAVYQYFNSAAALRAINRVLMLHGVVNVSDITAADDRALDQVFLVSNAFEGKRNEHIWPSLLHFGGKQWNSFSWITSTCANLWATGSSSQIPNGPTIGIGFCRQIENFSIFAWIQERGTDF
jgi:hypothetical protein